MHSIVIFHIISSNHSATGVWLLTPAFKSPNKVAQQLFTAQTIHYY